MADKKKVYSITINGLKESVDLTKSLNEQLAEIESSLKRIKTTKIKVEGELDVSSAKQNKKVVSGGNDDPTKRASYEDLVNKEKELTLQKQLTAEIKATGQAQAALTDSYKISLEETLKQRDAAKQVKQEMTDMFNGARDSAGNYTNTLAGLRAELRDLTKQQKSVEIGTDEYNKLDNQVVDLGHKQSQAIMDGEDEMVVNERLNKEAMQIAQKKDELQTSFIEENFDNVLGPGVFFMLTAGYPYPELTPWIEALMSKATDNFKNDAYVKDYYEKAKQNEAIMNGTADQVAPPPAQQLPPMSAAPTPNQMAAPIDSLVR